MAKQNAIFYIQGNKMYLSETKMSNLAAIFLTCLKNVWKTKNDGHYSWILVDIHANNKENILSSIWRMALDW